MKLKVLPIVIAVLTSCVLLFGGFFMYRSYAMENPLAGLVQRTPGVEQVDSTFAKDAVTVTLHLKDGASVREIYQTLVTDGASIIGDRKVNLKVSSKSSPEIDQWWSTVLFDIAQAMETRHYSDIPKFLDSKSASLSGLEASTEMDDQNVYIRLSRGENHKYIILPRVPAVMGVWPNE